jgi:hypothetical protein
MLRHVEHQLDVPSVQSLATPQSKQLRSLEHVLDLSAVQNKATGEVVEVGLADLVWQCAFEVLELCLFDLFLACTCHWLLLSATCGRLRSIVLLEEIGPDGTEC